MNMVKTRKNIVRKGFYKDLHDFYKPDMKKSKKKKKVSEIIPSNELKELIEQLNFDLICKLRSFRNQSLVATGKIQIKETLFLYLLSEYNFNGRYRNADNFAQIHKLESKRFFNEKNMTEMKKLHIRLQKGRKFLYSNESNMQSKKIQSNPYICFKFLRVNKVLN
jgi:hypothetical protein